MATPTILVVEDDIAIREMLRFVLDQNGFEIIDAEDAEIAQGILVEAPSGFRRER